MLPQQTLTAVFLLLPDPSTLRDYPTAAEALVYSSPHFLSSLRQRRIISAGFSHQIYGFESIYR